MKYEWDDGPEPHDFKQEAYDRPLNLADDMRDRAKYPNVLPVSEVGKTEPSVEVARSSHDVAGVECRACDWCRAVVVAKEDLVAHLEECETRKWAQHYGIDMNNPYTCPECGGAFATNDEAYTCPCDGGI